MYSFSSYNRCRSVICFTDRLCRWPFCRPERKRASASSSFLPFHVIILLYTPKTSHHTTIAQTIKVFFLCWTYKKYPCPGTLFQIVVIVIDASFFLSKELNNYFLKNRINPRTIIIGMYKYNNLTHLLIGGGQSFFWKNHEGSFETPRDELRCLII